MRSVLAVSPDSDNVQCAAWGRWLGTVSLVKMHDLTVQEYRARHGLGLKTVLESPARRTQHRASTLIRMEREPQVRAMLEPAPLTIAPGVSITRFETLLDGPSRSATPG